VDARWIAEQHEYGHQRRCGRISDQGDLPTEAGILAPVQDVDVDMSVVGRDDQLAVGNHGRALSGLQGQEAAVRGHRVDVRGLVRSEPGASLPDPSAEAVRRRQPGSNLFPGSDVERHDPAMVGVGRICVIGRLVRAREADVQLVLGRLLREAKRRKEQRGPLLLNLIQNDRLVVIVDD
jgi:hypothetical protein